MALWRWFAFRLRWAVAFPIVYVKQLKSLPHNLHICIFGLYVKLRSYITILTWHWKQFLVCWCVVCCRAWSNWLTGWMFIRLQKQFAHWSMQMVESLWVLSPFFPKGCAGRSLLRYSRSFAWKAVHVQSSARAQCPWHHSAEWFQVALSWTGTSLLQVLESGDNRLPVLKNTNVLDCRRLSLFKPWRRCLRAFLSTGRQVRFTLFAAGFFHEFGRSQQKICGMFLQMRPLFQISTHLCHKAYESGFDFQFIFHLRFSRRLDSQLVTVYATMWQWLDRPHI